MGPYRALYILAIFVLFTVAAVVDPTACSAATHAGIAGTVFAGYVLFQTIQMIPAIGWELINGENMVHHFCFLTASLIACNYYFGAHVVLAGIAMETSTPPLLALLTFRQIVGFERTHPKTVRPKYRAHYTCRAL